MEKLIVEMTHWPENEDGYQWYAEMPQYPGMGESGKTKEEAFNELMLSLKVLIAYNNNIDL